MPISSEDTTTSSDEDEGDDRSLERATSGFDTASEFSDEEDGYEADDDDTHAFKPPPRLSHFDRTIRALKEFIERRRRKKSMDPS